jgi:hypothetical protein
MACTNCPTNGPLTSFETQYFFNNQCFDCEDNGCGSATFNAKCVYYASANLSCSGIETNDSVELALQKIDEQICSLIGDYSTYNFNCLTAWFGETITTESQFVDAITGYACEIVTTLEEFTGTTFPSFQEDVDERFDEIEVPALTCTSAGVISTDNLNQILTKYCSAIGDLQDSVDLSTVNWDSCYTVVTPPTTLQDAFDLVIDQICQTKALTSGALPTFNNTGGCLSGGTSSDSLVTTIGLIKTKLCSLPTLDNDNLTSDCVLIPSTDGDLEGLLQNILDKIDLLSKNYVTFDNIDFDVTQTDGGDTCEGITVALATPIDLDRFVAVNGSDSSPGTLVDKIVWVGATADTVTNPGQLTVTVAATTDAHDLKASSVDDDPDFLDQKVNGGSDSGVTITTSYNASTKKVEILPSVDLSSLFTALLDEIEINEELKTRFCEIIASCPSPCDAPTNVQAIPETTTTTLP